MSNSKWNWKLSTRSVLGHYIHLCATPPVLPPSLQVCYCPYCRSLQVYQTSTKLICESAEEREQEKVRERKEQADYTMPVPTARHSCDKCKRETQQAKQKRAAETPTPEDTRYGREMSRRFPPPPGLADKAVGADLRYHGDGYEC